MEVEWDEAKRELNRRKHNLDFRLADLAFDGLTASRVPMSDGLSA
jgi:uncharacterized DUF497 family protein